MSQLEGQGKDLEANSPEVEEALRSSDGCKAIGGGGFFF